MKKYFALFVVCILALVSCEKEPVLTLSVDKIAVSSAGGSGSVVVNANNPWSVVGNDWCSASPSSGDGGEVTVTINVKENSTYESRNCTLVFASAGLTQSLQVSQDSNLGIVIPDDSYELSSAAQQISVEVKANVEYNVSVSADWIRLNGTKALSSKTYTFDVDANDTYGSRETVISIESRDGADVKQIKVKQVQNDAIVISTKEYGLSSAAQYIEVKLQTNVDIEVVTPSWISHVSTKALSDKTLVLSVDANEGYSARDGEVIVKQKSSSLSDTIKVHQAQKDAIILSKREYELSSQSHTLEISLQTNIDIEVVVPDDVKEWITYVQTKSLNERTLVIAVSENGTYGNRSGEIYVKNSASGIEEVISILQHQNDAILLAQREYEVSSEAQHLDVALRTNVAVDVVVLESAAEWISHIQTKSLTDKIISFAIKSNEGYDNRAGKVAVLAKDNDGNVKLADTLVITQMQKDAVIIKQKEYVVSSRAQALEVKLQANADIDVEIPESGKGWITYVKTKALSDKTVVLDIAENGTYDSRESEVYIINKVTLLKYAVNIIQVQNDALVISKESYNIASGGGSIELEVAHNVEYSVAIEGDWITQVQTRGLVTDKLLFVVAENTISEARTGSVTFASKDGKLSQKIIIEQDAKLFQLFYTSTDGNVVTPYVTSAWGDANIVSNVYENGQGIITFDKELKELPYRAFLRCYNLNGITIPDGVTQIGNDAFDECSSLKNILIPESVTEIGDNAFASCWGMEKFEGKFATQDGRCLIVDGALKAFAPYGLSSYEIPDGVKVITSLIEWGELESVTIPESVESIGWGAFYLHNTIREFKGKFASDGGLCIIIDGKLVRFAIGADLTEYVVPENVTSIGWCAFHECELSNVIIPEGVTKIDRYSFRHSKKLVSVTIPESVTEIGEQAFHYCTKLAQFFCKPVTPPSITSTWNIMADNSPDLKIYVPSGSVASYKAANYWKDYKERIVGYDFDNGSQVQPNNEIWYTTNSGNAIEPYASTGYGANIISNTYSNGKGVIVFDGEVTSISKRAFWNLIDLASISIPNSVTEIGCEAFYRTGISSFTIPQSVSVIGSGALGRCRNLEKIEGKFSTPDNRSLIVGGELKACALSGITEYAVPDGVTKICSHTFVDEDCLNSITIPESVKDVEEEAIYFCGGLTQFKGGCNLISADGRCIIVDGALVSAIDYGLEEYAIPDNVEVVCSVAFSNNKVIQSVTIPSGVNLIKSQAFYYCSNLSKIYCKPVTPPQLVSSTVFEGSNSDCKIYVPSGSVESYKSANYWTEYKERIVAYDFENGIEVQPNNEIWYTSTDGKVVTPSSSCEYGANIISNTYSNGKGVIVFDGDVTEIGEEAFRMCSKLTSISLPNSVKTIAYEAFCYCSSLTGCMTIPESVTKVEERAFMGCNFSSFKGKFASSDGRLLVIKDQAVAFAPYGLESYTFPENVKSLGNWIIYGCHELRSLVIPDNITKIGEYVVYNCAKFENVTIGKGVVSIGKEFCWGCPSLRYATVPKNVTSMGSNCFGSCSLEYLRFESLTPPVSSAYPQTNTYFIYVPSSAYNTYCENAPSYMKERFVVYNNIMEKCKSQPKNELWYFASDIIEPYSEQAIDAEITDGTCGGGYGIMRFNNDVTTIGKMAFRWNNKMRAVFIPGGVKTIGSYAFENNTYMSVIVLPESVEEVESYAFNSSYNNHMGLYCRAVVPPKAGDSILYKDNKGASNHRIYVPRNSVSAYKAADGWKDYADNIVGYDFN